MNGMSPDEARRKRAYGYVFQAAGLYPWRTIAKNISLPLEIMGFSKEEQASRVERVLGLVELSGFGNKYPWQLSGGMQQRASIARALAFDADILLMDEPFGALDEIVRDRLNEEVLKLWNRTGKTIGFVTHSIPEAVYLSTKIVAVSYTHLNSAGLPLASQPHRRSIAWLRRQTLLRQRLFRLPVKSAFRVADEFHCGAGGGRVRSWMAFQDFR